MRKNFFVSEQEFIEDSLIYVEPGLSVEEVTKFEVFKYLVAASQSRVEKANEQATRYELSSIH